MSVTNERKTLSIKGKPGMWQAPPSKDGIIENALQSGKQALNDFNAHHHPQTACNGTDRDKQETNERKTLSIKNKVGMWQTFPSKVEIIEKTLQDSAKQALEYFDKHHSLLRAYDDSYRLNHVTSRALKTNITDAFTALQTAVKFPTQARKLFETISNNVYERLLQEMGESAKKFKEAVDQFNHPKETLPKVSLSSFK